MYLENSLSSTVHLLVFETGDSEYPFFIRSTGFLVGYGGRVFLVTARHALTPQRINPLCILSPSGHVLPLLDVYFAPEADVEDDFADVGVVELDLQKIGDEHHDTRILPLESVSGDWLQVAQVAGCFTLGFPNECSNFNYDSGKVEMGIVELVGPYQGNALAPYLHEFKVENAILLKSFSGFSGSPVFCRHLSTSGCEVLRLCGMAVQGTPESQIIRFIDASVIYDMLELKCAR